MQVHDHTDSTTELPFSTIRRSLVNLIITTETGPTLVRIISVVSLTNTRIGFRADLGSGLGNHVPQLDLL